MDIYTSSWLIFPEFSLMVLCSGAELLLPTYFMTSCAPHAKNSASPVSTIQRLPSLTWFHHFFLCILAIVFICLCCFPPDAKDSRKLSTFIKINWKTNHTQTVLLSKRFSHEEIAGSLTHLYPLTHLFFNFWTLKHVGPAERWQR